MVYRVAEHVDSFNPIKNTKFMSYMPETRNETEVITGEATGMGHSHLSEIRQSPCISCNCYSLLKFLYSYSTENL